MDTACHVMKGWWAQYASIILGIIGPYCIIGTIFRIMGWSRACVMGFQLKPIENGYGHLWSVYYCMSIVMEIKLLVHVKSLFALLYTVLLYSLCMLFCIFVYVWNYLRIMARIKRSKKNWCRWKNNVHKNTTKIEIYNMAFLHVGLVGTQLLLLCLCGVGYWEHIIIIIHV